MSNTDKAPMPDSDPNMNTALQWVRKPAAKPAPAPKPVGDSTQPRKQAAVDFAEVLTRVAVSPAAEVVNAQAPAARHLRRRRLF